MKVINLFAGPGAGKSTTAAGLFNMMKLLGYNVELVTEFAKDLTWEGRQGALQNQLYILAKQEARLARLEGKVDFAITDSPLLLGLLYATPRWDKPWFKAATLGVWSLYENISFFIERTKPYNEVGRNQTEAQAKQLDQDTRDMLQKAGVEYIGIKGNAKAPYTLYHYIKENLNARRK
jgi:hypothetical protein